MRQKCDRCGRQNRREGDSVCDDCTRAMAGLAMAERQPGWQALVKEARRRDARAPDGITWKLWLFVGLPGTAALIIFKPSAIESLRRLLPNAHPDAMPNIDYYMVYGGLALAAYLVIWALVRATVGVFDR